MPEIGRVQQREITEEMRESYLDYAMSVIVARALPDVRDGLKPVHRRILYVMHEMGLTHAAKFRKSAAVVGQTLANYHPHGDIAVYDALVRMAQDFSFRYPLVGGQGNFGCFTGDTKVHLIDGRALSFIELIKEAKEGKKHYTYTFNPKTKRVEIVEIKAPRKTKLNAELVKVILHDGSEIRCTPDHRFMLRDGSYREAQKLKIGDSLMSSYTRLSTREDDPNIVGYEMVLQPFTQKWEYTHHLADEWNIARGVYARPRGKIRHHVDFNKRNNNPENVRRLQWEEHWRAHYEFTSTRHRIDAEYRRKLAEGRKAFYSRDDVKQKISERIRKWNKEQWKNPAYREEKRKWIQGLWKDPVYKERMAQLASASLKKKWTEEWFRIAVGSKKSEEMKRRWQNPEYRKLWEVKMAEISKVIWSDPKHRRSISEMMKTMWMNEEYRKRQSAVAKSLWKDPKYRSKYPPQHFVNAAKKLWADPATRQFHSDRAKKQWQDPIFREKISRALSERNKILLAQDPDRMRRLAKKSKAALLQKWQDPAYKDRVIKSKILRFASGVIAEYGVLTPQLYEEERTANWIPKIEKLPHYFSDFEELTALAKRYNHKVVSAEFLQEREDVYDLTIDETHNFALAAGIFVHNSIDGDTAAAMRYTETRMTRVAEELLRDIEKDTVDFRDNYDGTRQEPTVLPASIPNLLLNGTLGIAVGMATNIPPHNLGEVTEALAYLIDHPKASTDDLLEFVKGPDFPTGGFIYNEKEIRQTYAVGKGAVLNRGKAEIEERKGGGYAIVITEIPYQVNKSELIETMANLVTDKRLEGIRDIRDESDKEGLRIVIELKESAHPQKVLNTLYKFTDLEKSFHLNMLALVDGIQPQVLSLKGVLEEFVKHRENVVTRRTKFDLAKTKERIHILEGLKKALDHIDKVIETIKKSEDRNEAHANLMKKFFLSDLQSTAILEMRLQTLAGLERQKIADELKEKVVLAKSLEALLKDPKKISELIKKEVAEIKEKYGDERKTKVVKSSPKEISEEDIIPEEEAIIVLTRGGYIKRIKPESYRAQKRGGKGLIGMETKEEDVVEHLLTSNTHASLLFFTDAGKVYQARAYEVPEGTRVSKGKAIFNFLSLGQKEQITSMLEVPRSTMHVARSTSKEKIGRDTGIMHRYVVMVTKNGIMKKVDASLFDSVRKSGLIALTLKSGDALRFAKISEGSDEIILVSKKGQAVRFAEKDIRSMGRTAAGVRAMRLKKGDEVVGMDVITNDKLRMTNDKLLVVTENGYGKHSLLKQYKKQRRGGSGIKCAKITTKTGEIIGAHVIGEDEEELIAISRRGQVIRTALSSIPTLGRQTQGVRIMRMDSGDAVASITTL